MATTGQPTVDPGGGIRHGFAAIAIWGLAAVGALAVFYVAVDVIRRAGADPTTSDLMLILGVTAIIGVLAAAVGTWALVRRDAQMQHVNRSKLWSYVILGFLPIGVLAVGVGIYAAMAGSGSSVADEVRMAIVLSAGVIGLLLALAVVAVFFHGLQLNDKTEALGLPRGSIRAFIAIALILIFAIMSIYLFTAMAEGTPSTESADLAKQLVTTVSTLVVAISAFYFGSNSVQTATDSITKLRGTSSITIEGPSPLPKLSNSSGAWSPEEVSFAVRSHPPGMPITVSVFGDATSSVKPEGDAWIYRPEAPTSRVLLRFASSKDPEVFRTVELELEDPPPPPGGGGVPAAAGPVPGANAGAPVGVQGMASDEMGGAFANDVEGDSGTVA
ncbi:MAG: hypothetical protein ACSLFN_03130 [Candidatus Limnocylindrales bacterium]